MSSQRVSLLIVDDDPVFALFVQQLIVSLGAEFPCGTRWVDTAEKGLAELGLNNHDLVLLDYHLPGADGLHVLAEIHELPATRQPSVIMLTGSGSESVAVEAMKRGARDYLVKAGLDAPPLLRALRSALAQKQLADQVAAYNAQMRADLEMARNLQLSLLPDRYPSFPQSAPPDQSALRFHHEFCPAAELAGDFFCALPLSDTQAGVFICDVMGHGVRSALVTAMLRALVDNEALRVPEPGQFLAAMNARLARLIRPADGPMFATAFYMVVDVAAGRIDYATAGHPRPLHLQRRAGHASPLETPANPGPALGLFEDSTYKCSRASIAADDVLLLFTDGLFEVASAEGQGDYGKARLLEAARERMALPVPALCDGLIATVRQFAGGAEFDDDVCLLAVEVARLPGPQK